MNSQVSFSSPGDQTYAPVLPGAWEAPATNRAAGAAIAAENA